MRRFFVYAAVAIGLFMFLVAQEDGCSSDDGGTGQSDVENSLEYKLAVVNEGGYVPEDDPSIAVFARLLDSLDGICTESRRKIADMAVLTNETVNGAGVNESLRQTMQGVHDSTAGLTQPCADVFAAWTILRTP